MLSPYGGWHTSVVCLFVSPHRQSLLWRRRQRAQRLPPLHRCRHCGMVSPLSPSSSPPSNDVSGGGGRGRRGYADRTTTAIAMPVSCGNHALGSPSGSDASTLGSSFSALDALSTMTNPPLAEVHLHLHNETGQLSYDVIPDTLKFSYLVLDRVRLLPLLLL